MATAPEKKKRARLEFVLLAGHLLQGKNLRAEMSATARLKVPQGAGGDLRGWDTPGQQAMIREVRGRRGGEGDFRRLRFEKMLTGFVFSRMDPGQGAPGKNRMQRGGESVTGWEAPTRIG